MKTLTLPAPAKLNLFLHITGRRPDGYHNIQTVFQFLDYCDELTFQLRNDRQINLQIQDSDLPTSDNLVLRAAQLLQQTTATNSGTDITLKKKIPIGGGLGGGSSDAATTLIGLNQLWQTQLSLSQLAKLGSQLGADVAVFIAGHAAWAEGIGDQLQAIDCPESWFLVLVPPYQISTAEIYTAAELTRDTSPITISEFLKQGGHNDCEPVVRHRYPIIAQALDWLAQFAPAHMTGSGGCIFASFADKQKALAVAKQIPTPFQGWVAKGLNISPLHKIIGVSPSGKARGFDPRIPRFES